MVKDMEQAQAKEGKFLPLKYEARAFGAINGLCALRRLFQVADSDLTLTAGEAFGVEWILAQVIDELSATVLNCENGRRA